MDFQNTNGRQTLITWNGDENRTVEVQRYCECRTCQSAAPEGSVGYLTGSTPNGDGFTATIYGETEYTAARIAFGGEV